MSSHADPILSAFDPAHLIEHLARDFPRPSGYCVAFSGGLDSTVLLHALVAMRTSLAAPLAAVHIDHGLHADSALWADHCRAVCERLGVPLATCRVDAHPAPGESPEAAARAVRYAAMDALLEPGAMLLTAHHRDDQAETVLLQLLRGAGVEGLAAMPAIRSRGAAWHARPLLDVRRAALRDWAQRHALEWIDDPSNAVAQADRNYLRLEVLPILARRWPGAADRLAASAGHCADAGQIINERATSDLGSLLGGSGERLKLAGLRSLAPARAHQVLRAWLRHCGAPPLPGRRLGEAVAQLRAARADNHVRLDWHGWSLRVYRDEAWLTLNSDLPRPSSRMTWRGQELPGGMGSLSRHWAPGGIDPQRWSSGRVEIGFREIGLRCRPAGRAGTRTFKKLSQEHGIPPWLRDRLPVLFIDGEPAALANCCVCEPFAASQGGWWLHWTPPGIPAVDAAHGPDA